MSNNNIIVTRHAGLVEFLAARGITGVVVAHATAEDVKGKDVYGVLPLHLAAMCRTVTSVDMNLPADKRGAELTSAEVEKYFVDMTTYVVRTRADFNWSIAVANDEGYHGMLSGQI